MSCCQGHPTHTPFPQLEPGQSSVPGYLAVRLNDSLWHPGHGSIQHCRPYLCWLACTVCVLSWLGLADNLQSSWPSARSWVLWTIRPSEEEHMLAKYLWHTALSWTPRKFWTFGSWFHEPYTLQNWSVSQFISFWKENSWLCKYRYCIYYI